ncbi:flagellar type III secretion system protein FlhB [Parasphingorhabdus sp.]|uniref:EscU/YscU/HrcU family type III secretion system export apparatus switch protein n=1 Tax=Parasphingorhabdus sp. TaxID=2709688 RepID=UPI0032663E72
MAEEPPGGGEKTEAPTPKRLLDSVKKGDVLQSKELGTAMIIAAGTAAFGIFGPVLVDSLKAMLRSGLRVNQRDFVDFNPWERTLTLLSEIVMAFGLLFGLLIVTAIATPAVLGSLGFRWTAMKPKPSKLSPAAGLKRMFGVNSLIELSKSLAKVGLMGSIGMWLIWTNLPSLIQLGNEEIGRSISEFGNFLMLALMGMAFSLAVIAGIDVPAQIFQRTKKLRMTKQEVKDEHKETEGSPEVKGAIQRKRHEILGASARQAVKEATVVLANPTHFTVALRYRRGYDAVPVVLARARGAAALAMRELAEADAVPVLQYPELTRAIYFTSREGMAVDERLYVAIASVLAWLFRMDSKMASEMDRPHIDLPEDVKFDADGNAIEGSN